MFKCFVLLTPTFCRKRGQLIRQSRLSLLFTRYSALSFGVQTDSHYRGRQRGFLTYFEWFLLRGPRREGKPGLFRTKHQLAYTWREKGGVGEFPTHNGRNYIKQFVFLIVSCVVLPYGKGPLIVERSAYKKGDRRGVGALKRAFTGPVWI